jgi:AcrR family transcriptional regulator
MTAAKLFYAEGIHAVGVDRIAAGSGISKPTLYAQFGSKDELVAAYLYERAERWRLNVAEPVLARPGPPARRVGAVFARLAVAFASPEYRGCPFINAAAEYPGAGGAVGAAIRAHRGDVRDLFAKLLTAFAPARRDELTEQLVLLYDGTMVGAQLGDGTQAARRAKSAATRLIRGHESSS